MQAKFQTLTGRKLPIQVDTGHVSLKVIPAVWQTTWTQRSPAIAKFESGDEVFFFQHTALGHEDGGFRAVQAPEC